MKGEDNYVLFDKYMTMMVLFAGMMVVSPVCWQIAANNMDGWSDLREPFCNRWHPAGWVCCFLSEVVIGGVVYLYFKLSKEVISGS